MDLDLAIQMRGFAASPATRTLILNDDGMIKPLLNFLKSPNSETIKVGLESFKYLAEDSTLVDRVALLPNLLVTLATLTEYDEVSPFTEQIQSLSKHIIHSLTPQAKPSTEYKNERIVVQTQTHHSRAFAHRGYTHNITLRIPTMKTDEHKHEIEAILLLTKGVLAVTLDLGNQTANLFTSRPVAEFRADARQRLEEINHTVQEDPSEVKAPARGYIKTNKNNGDALVRYVDKSRTRQTQQNQDPGWLGGITSYFW